MPTKLQAKNKLRKLGLDNKALKMLNDFIETGLPKGDTLEVLRDVARWHDTMGFLTESQRKLIKKIKDDYADYDDDKELIDAVVEFYNQDLTKPGAAGFIESVVSQFRESNKITFLQREQLIGLADDAQNTQDEKEED